MKKIAVVIILIVLVAGGVILVKKRKEEIKNLPSPAQPVFVVEGVKVKEGVIISKREFIGLLHPVNTVNLSTKYAGYIKKIHVKTGQTVQKGQTLISLDDLDIKNDIQSVQIEMTNVDLSIKTTKAKIDALKVDLETKRNIYMRNKRLFEKKAVSKEALEKSLSVYKITLSQLEEAKNSLLILENQKKQLQTKMNKLRNQLRYLDIRSPVDGIVQRILIREGNLAVSGKPVLVLEEKGKYEVIVKLPYDFPVKEGDKVEIKFGNNKRSYTVSMVCPSVSEESLKVVKIFIGNKPPDIPSNSYINVSFIKELKGFIIPQKSIVELTGGSFVLSQEGKNLIKIPVEIIGSAEEKVAVKGNLREGMIVAKGESSKLRLLVAGRKGKIVFEEKQ